MKIKSLAPWFGGKRTLAPRIVAELGEHSNYFEPFCGSMAVLLAKPPCPIETVNDLHGHLTNLARVLQEETTCANLYARLNRTVMSEALFQEATARVDEAASFTGPDVDAAADYFVASWMGRNGAAGTSFGKRGANHSLSVRWTAGGGSPTVRFDNAVQSIPAWHTRLKNVVILNRDAIELLERPEDHARTAIYVDPPYASETRSGYNGSGGHSRYVHELDHDLDHERIARALNAYQHARVVVSYYDCPRVRELYEGWTFLAYTRNKHLCFAKHGTVNHRKAEAPEVLIVNGPSRALRPERGLFE